MGIVAERVVKDVCSGAFVVIDFLEGEDFIVDPRGGSAGMEVRAGLVSVVISVVGSVGLCGLVVVLFGVSSKSDVLKQKAPNA